MLEQHCKGQSQICCSHRNTGDWLQLEWEQGFVCRPVQLEVAAAMMEKSFDRQVLQLNMGEGKSKVILRLPQTL